MSKKIGFFLLIGAACSIVGYHALQAGTSQGQAPVSVATSSPASQPGPEFKTTDAELRLAQQMEVSKAEIERAEELQRRMDAGEAISESDKVFLLSYVEQHPEFAERGSSGNPLDNVGGPDASNYYFVDNVAPDTATYNWIELRGDPGTTWINSWTSHDDGQSGTARYPIGFSFPFYGVNQDSFRIATNGFIQFTTTATSLSNVCLPASIVAGPAIFPFWDDLHLDRGGITNGVDVVGFKNFGTYTVIEFDSIGFYSTSCATSLKFEAILYSDGRVKLQYNLLTIPSSCLNSATIGIQSNGTAGSPALTYVCNTTGIQPAPGRAIWFYQFLYTHNFATTSISSPTGSYPGNTPVTVTARFTNFGTTTESSPVSYSFNGGPTVTENTAPLATNGFEDHTFGTQFTTPSIGGTYVLTVWSDLATDELRGNDTLRTNVVVCASNPVPFAEGFEGTTGTALPLCWTIGEFDTDNRVWAGTSSYYHSGSRAAYCTYSSSAVIPNDWLFTTPLSLAGGTSYTLELWAREYLVSSTYYDSLEVLLTTATDNNSTLATVVPIMRLTSSTWSDIFGTVTPPSTDDYYLAFRYTGGDNDGGIIIDDISFFETGSCTAPTVSVADASGGTQATLLCTATGGSGGALQYQWYTGQTCTPGNEIAGANNSTYTTAVEGDFACKAWRVDPDNCSGCDWGRASIGGESCTDAIEITPPTPGTPTVVYATSVGYINNVPDSCEYSRVNTSPDVFFSLTIDECRRLTFALSDSVGTGGDTWLAVYTGDDCGGQSLLCNDDKGNFATIPWEDPSQRPTYSLSSFVGGELTAGTYYIRLSRYSGTGNFRLIAYDNGPCPCQPTCQGGDIIEVAENPNDPAFALADPDGGCNNTTPTYGTIALGQTVCGVGFTYQVHSGASNGRRDTDWYQFTLNADGDVNLTVTPEFQAVIGFIGTDCGNPVFIASQSAPACEATSVITNLTAGTYNAFVAPDEFAGNPLPSIYRATLSSGCAPDTVSNLTVYRDPAGSNDVRLRWTPDGSFPGTYTVYYNTVSDPNFPGTWTVLVSDLPPTTTEYVDTGAVGANARKFYLVVSVCP